MNRKARHSEKGAELVEMAFVLLLFLVLMIGVFQFGRAYNIYQNITNAARRCALRGGAAAGGTINYPNNSEVSNVISGFMQSSNLDLLPDQHPIEQSKR
jgi:Flp pilus assembly protein TadG